ncbi:mitochondrial import inner membrane translocase subunit tim22 [Endogone sp. FLAS-F59071]|nr:mitochondrial import inner membrane translocase subunit tim22 [Endogone sp. FLAS-F59071]|eukprot:RUS16086.1 mitochondrial import inner membrane translocase subunit tim22 [Endogone sp. FLAS-F59071]
MSGPFQSPIGRPPPSDMERQVKMMHAVMESCPFKFATSGVIGFGLGAAFGLIMSSFEYSGPTLDTEIVKQTTGQQIKSAFKDMGTRSYSMAKNFAVVGAIFSGTECIIESYRAKNDIYNGTTAGCITGGVLAARAGPQAAAFGCVGFAAFSAAIEWYMRRDP